MDDDRIESRPSAKHVKYERLIETARKLPPVRTAIAHPCDQISLESAIEAAKLGLITPILVGPKSRIQEVAARWNLDISGMPIIDADKARTIFAIKRSKNPGFAGIDNELYFSDRTWMLFGDAKAVLGDLVKELSGGSGMH